MAMLLWLGLANAVCAALLALLALLVGRYCRRPAVLHSLWLLVLCKLVTPPLWPVTVYNVEETVIPVAAPSTEPANPSDYAPALPVPLVWVAKQQRPALSTRNVQQANIFKARAITPPAQPITYYRPTNTISVSPDKPPTAAAEPDAGVKSSGLDSLVPLLSLAWFLGVVVWFVWAAVRIGRFQHLLRHARRAGSDIQVQTDQLAVQMGLRCSPEIWLLPGALPPLVWGALGRARIYFPAKL